MGNDEKIEARSVEHVKATEAIKAIESAIVETIKAENGRPVPEGVVYLALTTHLPWLELNAYQRMIEGLIKSNRLKRGRFPHSLQAVE